VAQALLQREQRMIQFEVPIIDTGPSIYGLMSYPDLELRYIGYTSKSVNARFKQHMLAAKRGNRLPVYDWIRKVHRTGRTIIPAILRVNANFYKDEQECISITKRAGHRLLNMTTGGIGAPGAKHTAEYCQKISKRTKEFWGNSENRVKRIKSMQGVKKSKEHLEKLKLRLTALNKTPEHIEKSRKGKLGVSLSEEHKKKLRAARALRPTITEQERTKLKQAAAKRVRDSKGHFIRG
jgi:hypothetical protein